MATLRDIRRRIRSVESTQKITRAMKLVAAAKLRRAQERILEARPYAFKMAELVGALARGVGEDKHPLLVRPNLITNADFEGWVQERGLYFAGPWDPGYDAVLSANDPGEPPRDGGLIYAHHGKGVFIYTGYSWFRQLPAGVPGAYRLFANLVSAGR